MSNGQVDYIEPTIIKELSSVAASFNSEKFAVNNNKNISFILSIALASSLDGSAKVQGSHDASTWIDLSSTSATFTGDDDILWTLSEVESLMYLRLAVTVSTGSSVMQILARGT